MKIEALKSFCGALSMSEGEVRECSNETVLADLLAAGYVREVRAEPEKKRRTAKKDVSVDESQQD
jgi:hypothetical protein